ncbi:acyltransferase family protein [Psychrobacter sp. FDAARGOS_221]|uniref:acyltransferase family protein n=1 Tax=Psychrobacter sp. FDAARGOS_221 TaxID=1975705 RepID=UPI000BB57E04|nr:acyltransferase family protein [Psychrobacter sp. FDAARGOS_221]PNK60217.1 acyltransferase [Psychrobacter sp. FDAARGOS_221]
MKFRTDINGLRAVAVVAVVLFHFNPAWMPGGFAGVDVFFVISGFLMTSIIFRGLENQNFLLSKFYMARANRIVPALAALCIALLIFGWFYLIPLDYKVLGRHVASSIGFFSNFTYNNEAGYFDTASHQKWLLHSWSLSVEWQFYIIYPLLLVLLGKFFSLQVLKRLILASAIVGFAYCIYASYKTPDSAYYLLPSRAWEMMVGGIAYLYPITVLHRYKKYAQWIGLAAVTGSYLFISAENAWPGYLALFPVIGTFLIIQSQREDGLISRNALAQKLGAWSYSIYLWHWPLVVAIYYFDLPKYSIFIGILLSVGLGYLSYHFIEKRNWHTAHKGIKKVLTFKPLYMMILIAIVGRAAYKTEGFIWHYSPSVIAATEEANNKNPYRCMLDEEFPCYIGNKDNIRAIMVGDSHADAITTALADALDLNKEGIIALTRSSCPFILDAHIREKGVDCKQENLKRLEFLQSNYQNTPVFWGSRTAVYLYGQNDPERIINSIDTQPLIYFDEEYQKATPELLSQFNTNLDRSIQQISANRTVYLVLPVPEMQQNIPKRVSRALLLQQQQADVSLPRHAYDKRNKEALNILYNVAKNDNVQLLDPTRYLCSMTECMGEYHGRPIYYDGDHLSEYGNRLLIPMFKQALSGSRE